MYLPMTQKDSCFVYSNEKPGSGLKYDLNKYIAHIGVFLHLKALIDVKIDKYMIFYCDIPWRSDGYREE